MQDSGGGPHANMHLPSDSPVFSKQTPAGLPDAHHVFAKQVQPNGLPADPLKGLVTPGATAVPDAPTPPQPRRFVPQGAMEQFQAETRKASAPAVADFNRRAGTHYSDIPAGWKPEDIKQIHDLAAKNPKAAEIFGSFTDPIEWVRQAIAGGKQIGHGSAELAHGKLLHGAEDVGLGGLSAAAVLPVGHGLSAVRDALAADKAVNTALKSGNFGKVRDIAQSTAPSASEAKAAANAAVASMPHDVFRQLDITPDEFARHLQQGAGMRYWYEESAHGILNMAGGNKNLADKYAQVTAIMSAQKEPLPNIQLANRAIHEYNTYGKVISGDEHQAAKATAVLRGEKWNGVKTDRFYKNMLEEINPRKYRRLFGDGEVTNDIWMARLYGLKSDVPTPREYAAMTKATQEAAHVLGWKPKQVQAAQWISKKAESEPRAPAGGASTFADALQLEHARVPFEAAPGREAAPELHNAYQNLGSQQREAYTSAKAALVKQYLRESDLMARMGGKGPGVYEGEVNPGRSVDIAASRDRGPFKEDQIKAAHPEAAATMRDANRIAGRTVHPETRAVLNREAATIGHALNQDAAVWHKPFFVNIAKKDANGMRLSLGRTITSDQARALNNELRADGHGDIAIVHHPMGADILNTEGLPNREFHQIVTHAADKAGISGDVLPFAYDGNYIDRSEYASHLEAADAGRGAGDGVGGADLQHAEGRRADALSRLVAGSAAVDRQFLSGGGLGARLADESGHVDLSRLFPEPVRSREEAQAHLLDAAAKARSEGWGGGVGGKGNPALIEKGVATPETGAALGQKIREALSSAHAVRKTQAEGYSEERTNRVRAASEASLKAGGGMTGHIAAKRQLAGELPKEFFGHLTDITPDELHQAAKVVDTAPLQFFEKTHAKDALAAMVNDGIVPNKSDHALLERVFGRVAGAEPDAKAASFWDKFVGALNIPRAIRSSGDISAGFRQGLVVLVTHPKVFWREWKKQIRSFGSEEFYQAQQDAIHNDPLYPLMHKYGVPFTDIGGNVPGQEEAFVGAQAAEHIPVAGRVVRMSDRAFTGFQNGTRAELFKLMAEKAAGMGHDFVADDAAADHLGKSIARVVGTFTGRGVVPKLLESHLTTMNAAMFSPRLMASRMNLLSPVYYAKLDPFARREALAGARNLVGAVGATMFAASLLGAQVNFDPRSSNFAKIKVGNTRIDIAGGFSQYIRFIAQEMTREEISSAGHKGHIGWGQHDISDLANATKLARSKSAPIPSFLWDELSGKDFIGQPVKQGHEVWSNAPFVLQDSRDAYQKSGPKSVPIAAFLSAIGLGVQSYVDKPQGRPTPKGGGAGLPSLPTLPSLPALPEKP